MKGTHLIRSQTEPRHIINRELRHHEHETLPISNDLLLHNSLEVVPEPQTPSKAVSYPLATPWSSPESVMRRYGLNISISRRQDPELKPWRVGSGSSHVAMERGEANDGWNHRV